MNKQKQENYKDHKKKTKDKKELKIAFIILWIGLNKVILSMFHLTRLVNMKHLLL